MRKHQGLSYKINFSGRGFKFSELDFEFKSMAVKNLYCSLTDMKTYF
jgi:hypothetical protein